MSIELALLRHVETLVQKGSPGWSVASATCIFHLPCSKTSGWKAKVQIAHIREREFQTGFRLGNRIT